MKKTLILLLLPSILLFSCGSNDSKDTNGEDKENSEMSDDDSEEQEEVIESTFYGDFNLTDMIPVTNGKELTKVDKDYIAQSKERTIGKTVLTLNEDGTFKRVFPHPSGDGSTQTWEGKYTMDEANKTLVLNAEMNGKTMPMDFKIIEKSDDKLSITTSFGQIDMNYVYTK